MSEAEWEHYVLDQLGEYGWQPLGGSSVAPRTGERAGWDDLVLTNRLRDALRRNHPDVPASALNEAIEQLTRRTSQDVLHENRNVHRLLTRGIKVTYTDATGQERTPTIWAIDHAYPDANEFLAVSQVSLHTGKHRRRFDVVCYVNGLPLAIFELKKAGGEDDSYTAYLQLQTYRRELGVAGFAYPLVQVASDGLTARVGSPFSAWEHMARWNVDEEGEPVDLHAGDQLDVLISGVFGPGRFLDLITNFVSFSADDGGSVNSVKLAKAHQFFAVNKAVARTVEAVGTDGKAGVVWHTQGSGKSKEMEFYAAKVARHPALANPTLLVLTDRIDLDDQLFRGFAGSDLLPSKPIQTDSRAAVRAELDRPSGGIVFSTLQKFMIPKAEHEAGRRHPVLSTRTNVIVIVDEAHRSHYELKRGLARNLRDALPNATFIAFTGTPLSKAEADTQAVFGTYIDIYDLSRAVDDGATVPVFYENRFTPVRVSDDIDFDDLDERAEDITADLDEEERKRSERVSHALENIIGTPEFLRKMAADIIKHWETRREAMIRLTGYPGKAMIVGLTRRVCALLYNEIERQSEWGSKGLIKVAYTGDASDEPPVSDHLRKPAELKKLQRHLASEGEKLELVIVQSLWLTGFDAPPLHTLYLGKPMQGAALMQALARVNRRFGEKDAGLVVDYLGIADDLTRALADYTPTDQERKPIGDEIDEKISLVQDLHDCLSVQLHGYDWRAVLASGVPRAYHLAAVGAVNHIKRPEPDLAEGRPTAEQRFLKSARELSRAFALCATDPKVAHLIGDIAFFDTVRLYHAKFAAEDRAERGISSRAEVEFAIRQLAATALAVDEVVDIYAAAGLQKPDLSHLDEKFVARLQASKNPNLALEALRRAIEKEIRAVNPHNLVRQKTFSERLVETMRRYTNGALTSAEIISAMVDLAKEVSADRSRGEELGLTSDELAFYDAVSDNESAVRELGAGILADIARDLVVAIRRDRAVDWSKREQVQARLRSKIKRLLAKHGYPPDAERAAVELVLRQAKTFAEDDAA